MLLNAFNLLRQEIAKILTIGSNALFIYISAICFLVLSFIISFSVKSFVNNTLSFSIQAIEEDAGSINRIELFVKSGDTFSKILYRQNLPVMEIQAILESTKKLIEPLNLKLGQKIVFEYEMTIQDDNADDLLEEKYNLKRIDIAIDKTRSIEVVRHDNYFLAQYLEIPLKLTWVKASTVVKSNFMSAARSLGIPHNNIIDLVNIYSHNIDFQRQIKPGDNLNLILEKYITEDGQFSHYGKVVFASLTLSGKDHKIYRYSGDDNSVNDNMHYFSEEGKSVKRNLLRTPIGVSRISSGFGHRKDPILGYTKMHKGVDFAAPTGTPIYSAGHGVVTDIGWRSGYGNYIQIKHSSSLSTAYAHANAFAKGLKIGAKVKQGQVIAYVGKTGTRATGPHLHYEVRINGKHVNPLSIKTSPGIELTGHKLHNFTIFKKKINQLHNDLNENEEYLVTDNFKIG